jgi:hypothetical protein
MSQLFCAACTELHRIDDERAALHARRKKKPIGSSGGLWYSRGLGQRPPEAAKHDRATPRVENHAG